MEENIKYPNQTNPKDEYGNQETTIDSSNLHKDSVSSVDSNILPAESVISNNSSSKEVTDIIIADGMEFRVNKIDIGLKYIQFTLEDLTIYNALDIFRGIEDISLSKSNASEPYGTYSNLTFTSAVVSADNTVTVTLSILSESEVKLKETEKVQSNIEEIMSKLIYGEDVSSNSNSIDLVTRVIRNRMNKGESFDSIIKDYPKMSDTNKKYVKEGCFRHR